MKATAWGLDDFNAALKDYVLKQDLKKDFTEYKHDADRKEMLRDYYYSVVEDPGKLEYAMLYCCEE